MIKHIPNFITCLNLVCGCLGCIAIMHDQPQYASYLIILALVFDFFDGFAARMLHVASPIGKELDSLADVVSFGLLPGLIMYWLIAKNLSENMELPNLVILALPFLGFVLTVFSALRLAKFNVDTRQTDSFIGVPTPANALLIASLVLIDSEHLFFELTSSLVFLVGTTLIMSWLLVSPLPLIALKFKSYSWDKNKFQYTLLLLSLLLFAILKFGAMPIIIILYITISLLSNRDSTKQRVEI
ncbi:MAG TPA: CDP-diacylglycerol--serine O-phosphatidyltransferase [Cytophagaceae bacterium]|jgi:CDP-diacylglycerol--serine O-phosphatidyltransferase